MDGPKSSGSRLAEHPRAMTMLATVCVEHAPSLATNCVVCAVRGLTLGLSALGRYLKEPGSNGLLWIGNPRASTLFFCDHGNRRIGRLGVLQTTDGRVQSQAATVTVTSSATIDGAIQRLNSPNDLAQAPDGSIWFTDPSYGLTQCQSAAADGEPPSTCISGEKSSARETNIHGVYRVSPRGENEVAKLMLRGMAKPNGIAFSADGKRLFVSNSGGTDSHVKVWDLDTVEHGTTKTTSIVGGEAAGKRIMEAGDVKDGSGKAVFRDWVFGRHHRTIRQQYAEAGHAEVAAPWDIHGAGGVDGMATDRDGRLWAACPGGVCVFDVAGQLLGTVATSSRVGNCMLGGDGWLYIAATSELLRVQTTLGDTI